MTQENGKPLDPVELAGLPADDPRRRAFTEQLGGLSPEQRRLWNDEFVLTDRLRQELSDVEVPAALHNRLLAIPQSPQTSKDAHADKPARAQRRFRGVPLYAAIAAALVIIAGLVTYYQMANRPPEGLPYLDAGVSKKIAALAVEHNAAPVVIASSDPEVVKKSLETAGLDVPVIMLTPTAGSTLAGGGTCDFGGTKAAFTQWKNGESSYTLYQFDGTKLGVPALFYAAILKPTELWHDALHYRVAVFPGAEGKCCWALVMNTDDAKNIFSQYTNGY